MTKSVAPSRESRVTEVADLLHQVNRMIRRQAQVDAGPDGVTGSQMRAMRVLAGSLEPMRMSELAVQLGIARRSATSVVDELEESGVVERIDDACDRRAVGGRLTDVGQAAIAAARRRRRTAADRVLAVLDEADLGRLQMLLQRVVSDHN